MKATEGALDYKAGHILGLEIAHPESGEGLKGPYTVTRPVDDDSFDVIYRVIPDGRKTPFMESLAPGDTVRFGGRFGTPVADGIATDCDRVIGVATGAGLGPLVGYAEAALAAADGPAQIELFCGFRDLQDVCGGACEALAQAHPERFSFTPVISRPMACTAVGLAGIGGGGGGGSITAGLLGDMADAAAPAPPPAFVQGRVGRAVPSLLGDAISSRTHFHLVGNGQFVKDFQQGLLQAGVPEARVTKEIYFNGKATVDEDEAAFVAQAMRSRLDSTRDAAPATS